MRSSSFLVLPRGCKGRGKGPNVVAILDQLCRTCKAPRLEYQMPRHRLHVCSVHLRSPLVHSCGKKNDVVSLRRHALPCRYREFDQLPLVKVMRKACCNGLPQLLSDDIEINRDCKYSSRSLSFFGCFASAQITVICNALIAYRGSTLWNAIIN